MARVVIDTHHPGLSLGDRETKGRRDSVDTDEENNEEASTSKVDFKGE